MMWDDDYDDENYRNQPINPADKWYVGLSAALLIVCLLISLVQ